MTMRVDTAIRLANSRKVQIQTDGIMEDVMGTMRRVYMVHIFKCVQINVYGL